MDIIVVFPMKITAMTATIAIMPTNANGKVLDSTKAIRESSAYKFIRQTTLSHFFSKSDSGMLNRM